MQRFLSVVLGLCLLTLAAALARVEAQQLHPCEAPVPANPTVLSGAPHKVQFCSPASDDVEALVAYVDGVAFDLLPASAVSAPSAKGLVLFESPTFLQVQKGAHTLQVAAYNRSAVNDALQLGPKSAPFPFAAADATPLPAAPLVLGVSR